MKVKEFIKLLQETDPDREIIMSRDSEGNGYSPLSSFWEGAYVPESSCRGEVYYDSLEGGSDPEDVRVPGEDEGAVAAIILSPV